MDSKKRWTYTLRHCDLVQLHGFRPSDASEVVTGLLGIVLAITALKLLDLGADLPSEARYLGSMVHRKFPENQWPTKFPQN